MPTPHETFGLWLILSLGIHVATLVLWPLPPSWKVVQPSYVAINLRPTGGSAGEAPITPASPQTLVDRPAPKQSAKKNPPAFATVTITSKTHTRSLVKSYSQPLLTELSKTTATPSDDPDTSKSTPMPTPVHTSNSEGPTESDLSINTSGIFSDQPGGIPERTSDNIGGIPSSGISGAATGQGMLRATPLGYGDNPAMPYPRIARRRGWQGEVLLHVSVSESGRVVSADIEQSSGYGILDDTAIQQVSGWRFRPASRHGVPRPDTVLVPVHFQLHSP